jgi:putative transposase
MSRPRRIIKQNVTYHCYSRCIENRKLLKPDFVKEIVLQSVNKAIQYYCFDLSYIEFVDNHIHIIIKTINNEATISRIMQYIKARITEKYNKENGRTGTFWNERFKSEIIENSNNPQERFIRLIWYLSYHTVRKEPFSNPRDNPYSSINIYLGYSNQTKIPIHIHEYYSMLGNSDSERTANFKKYETSYSFQ